MALRRHRGLRVLDVDLPAVQLGLDRIIPPPRRGGVATDLPQFLAPLEFSTTAGSFVVDGEVGRNFVHGGESEWVAGGVVAHACGAEGECLLEIRETNAPS